MLKTKRLGIWMDHSSAHLIEFPKNTMGNQVIESKFTYDEKKETLARSENVMHNKEQHQQAEYYKALGEVIKNYNEVVLFGPTDARNELFNTLKTNHHFENIKIEVHSSDKMDEAQQHDFVTNYFSNSIKK